jgi:RNA polymerase sigma-70 factor (sigma-E family)
MRRSRRESEFVAFVGARQAGLRRIAYALCGDWSQAEDLVQLALVKLYVAWPRVRRDGREEAYVRQILVRANIDEHRRPWRREQPMEIVPDRTPAVVADSEVRDDLVAALQELPSMQRRTVVLRHWLGLSVEETAVELGIAEGTVKAHCSRGLQRLQSLLTVVEPSEDR